MIHPIYLYGSQVLRDKSEEVDIAGKEELRALLDDLVETMHNADGCGLAAPQIGLPKRVVVVDGRELADRYPYLKDFHREMINPVVTFESDETAEYNEGCLSIPNVDADVVRPKTIRVHYFNYDLEEVEEEFDLFAARMVQHELDHLDGILFTDHASQIRRKMISGKLANISKGKVHPRYNSKLVTR